MGIFKKPFMIKPFDFRPEGFSGKVALHLALIRAEVGQGQKQPSCDPTQKV